MAGSVSGALPSPIGDIAGGILPPVFFPFLLASFEK
jgi:hypothetical protein